MSNVYEVIDSMSGSITKEVGQAVQWEIRRRYVVGVCESFDDCVTTMQPYCPMYVQGNFGVQVRSALSVSGVGNGYFDVVATYQTLQPAQGDNNNGQPPPFTPGSVAWDTTGNREHMTMAISQLRYPAEAPDFEGAINVVGNSVQGIDVVRPAMRYSETWIMPAQDAMQCNYLTAVYSLTGTVNQSTFRCFDPGEALFLGARGQWQEDQPYVAITFEFEARPNDDNYYPWIGYGAGIEKEGWEHFWILYEDGVDADTIIKKPVAGYMSQVYHKANWAGLGIGSRTIGAGATGVSPQPGLSGFPGGGQ
jgi:hypothetical protein